MPTADDKSHHVNVNVPSTSTSAPQWQSSNRQKRALTHRDHDASRQNSYELDQLCDALNLTGQVKLEGAFAVTHGGSANVWKGSLNGGFVAVKVIREHACSASLLTLKRRLVREVRAWSVLYHRNVLPLLGFIYGAGATELASLVSPWMYRGTATAYLRERDVATKIRVVTGVADGLCYLHRHDVVHGDLKGDNILIDDTGEPRLSDFGLSKLISDVISDSTPSNIPLMTQTVTFAGSVRWMAREMFSNPDGTQGVTRESDVWAFGMTVVELFTSNPPFFNLKNDAFIIIAIHNGEYPSRPPQQCGMDDELWDLCLSCWKENPALRPTARVISKQMWDVDLRCKLRTREKRRHSREDENESPSNAVGKQTGLVSQSSTSSHPDPDTRVHKSPKLGTLADLERSSTPASPSTPMNIARALIHSPVPMRARTRSYGTPPPSSAGYSSDEMRSRSSSFSSTSVPSMASSSGSSSSLSLPSSAESSSLHLQGDIDPRMLFSPDAEHPHGPHLMHGRHPLHAVSRTHSDSALGVGEVRSGQLSLYGYGHAFGHEQSSLTYSTGPDDASTQRPTLEDLHSASAPSLSHPNHRMYDDVSSFQDATAGPGAIVHRHRHHARYPSSLRHATVPSMSPAASPKASPVHTPSAAGAHFELSPRRENYGFNPTSPSDHEFRHPSQWISSTYPYNYARAHGGQMTPSYPAFFTDLPGGGAEVEMNYAADALAYSDNSYATLEDDRGMGMGGGDGVLGLGLSGVEQRTITMGGLETPLATMFNGEGASISEYFTEEPLLMHEHHPDFLPQHYQRDPTAASFSTPHIPSSPALSDVTPMQPFLDYEDDRFSTHFGYSHDVADTPVIPNFDSFEDDILGEDAGNALLGGLGLGDGMALFGGTGVEDGADQFRFKSPSPAPVPPSAPSRQRRGASTANSRSNSGPYPLQHQQRSTRPSPSLSTTTPRDPFPFARPLRPAPRSPGYVHPMGGETSTATSRSASLDSGGASGTYGSGHGYAGYTQEPAQLVPSQMPTPQLSPLLSSF